MQDLHIAVLDVSAILPEVERDRIGSGLLRRQGGLYRLGIGSTPGLPKGGDVVDIHTEQDFTGMRHGHVLSTLPPPAKQLPALERPVSEVACKYRPEKLPGLPRLMKIQR